MEDAGVVSLVWNSVEVNITEIQNTPTRCVIQERELLVPTGCPLLHGLEGVSAVFFFFTLLGYSVPRAGLGNAASVFSLGCGQRS